MLKVASRVAERGACVGESERERDAAAIIDGGYSNELLDLRGIPLKRCGRGSSSATATAMAMTRVLPARALRPVRSDCGLRTMWKTLVL